jgi:hypothetical protein
MFSQYFTNPTLLIDVLNRLRRGFAQFNLCTDFLDLPLQISKGSLEILILLDNHRFQFLNFAVLFEELIEQHRVYLIVAYAVGFAFLITKHQVRVDLFHVLGHKAKLGLSIRINLLLVMETDRFESED